MEKGSCEKIHTVPGTVRFSRSIRPMEVRIGHSLQEPAADKLVTRSHSPARFSLQMQPSINSVDEKRHARCRSRSITAVQFPEVERTQPALNGGISCAHRC